MHFGPVTYIVGYMGLIAALGMLFCSAFAMSESQAVVSNTFLISALITAFVAMSMVLIGRRTRHQVATMRNLVLVGVGTWIFIPIFGALPLLGSIQINDLYEAIFESFASFTTSGPSIIFFPELDPKSLTLWRHFLMWFGGFWTLVFVVCVLAPLRIGGMVLSASPLLQHDASESVSERLIWPARHIIMVYGGGTVAGALILMILGVAPFDAICLAMAAISTTGISPQSLPLLEWMPIASVYALFALTFIGGMALPLWFIMFRNPLSLARNEEWRIYVGFVLMFTLIYGYFSGSYVQWGFFQALNLVSTSGFHVGSEEINAQVPMFLIMAPLAIGAMSLSTGGGLKVIRFMTVFKFLQVEMRKMSHPSALFPVFVNERRLTDNDKQSAFTFLVIVGISFIAAILLFNAAGFEFVDSLAFTISFLGNSAAMLQTLELHSMVASFNGLSQFVAILLMLLGRLDLIIGLALFTTAFWRLTR